ncbi:DoxX family protein [Chroococcus sp. FPU101]|uniref:DoxX family protein n=1 Tax=Chroococcus sp. FPU101 TaxID=1974212 RepID=UPI001A8D079E|nr:DoxX family protein [Chroococcus sp. FPU101]GFE67884.1 DoxX, putative [Chroococcus sp. FPU101]
MTAIQNKTSLLSKLFNSTSTDNTTLQIAQTILRVGVGLLMIHNGFSKLADVQKFADNVVSFIGLPFPVFFTYCAAYTEIVGSILLLLGLFTRLNALGLLFTMGIAIFFHLKKDGLQVASLETASLYGFFYLFFLLKGGGKFSLDTLLAKWLAKKEQ